MSIENRFFHVPAQYQLPGPQGTPVGTEFLALPKRDIPMLVARYLTMIETGTTEDWCQCVWSTHPDDVDIKAGQCRDCLHANSVHNYGEENNCSKEDCFCTGYRSRRVKKISEAQECPVHTKTGLIMGLYEYLFGEAGRPALADKRTPDEWLKTEFKHIRIVDNDGWTFSEWTRQDPITKQDFDLRLSKCTIVDHKLFPQAGLNDD
jgi:hypothetical protein